MHYQQQTAKVSGLFDTIFNTAVKILPFVAGGSRGNSTQAKGLQQITAYVNQVLNGLQQVKNQVSALSANDRRGLAGQLIPQVQQLEQTLYNHAIVYQAKNGRDAEVLRNGKTQAKALVQQIQLLFETNITNTENPTNPNSILPLTSEFTRAEWLTIAGIGLAFVAILKKKK